MDQILKYFPSNIKTILETELQDKKDIIEEIRIRVQKPIILKFNLSEKIVRYIISQEEILNILQHVCENSIYSYQSQIAEGFVTVTGGHRVGISGSCVIEKGKVININYINSLNFRISKQILGCSENLLENVLDLENNTISNTLIVSPPGAGKTTILRDLVKQISSGIKSLKFKGINVGVVDERGEIAALYKGVPQNEIGIKTDVIDNIPKSLGVKMLIRSMAPKVIVADEIGTLEDVEIINYAICSGCKGIFTAHGSNFDDLYLNPMIKELINRHVFEVIIFLDTEIKGEVKSLYLLDKKEMQYKKQEEKIKEDPVGLEFLLGEDDEFNKKY